VIFFFDSNLYCSVFTKNAIKNPDLAKKWLATWRDVDGRIHHDILHLAETNNQAEYGSMLMILRHLRSWVDKLDYDNDHNVWLEEAIIYGDSQIVIYQMTGRYRVKESDLQLLWAEATNLVHVLKEEFGIIVRFRWVGRDINNEALNLKGRLTEPGPE
jgi:ribonuclease HI